MQAELISWLGLAVRWFHVIFGIAWIGASFYFIWLDNSLRKPKGAKKGDADGELWCVHGGGFYHKKKYMVAPDKMPADLHWFKWEAYLTWVSGFVLLGIIYYMGADLFLLDKTKAALMPWQGIALSLVSIIGGWLFYDRLCRTEVGQDNVITGYILFFALVWLAYLLDQVFSDRAAFVHVGVIMGTMMAANVFMVIIPNQKKVVASLIAGEKPDPALGKIAKQRSLHNNYLTLPVVLLMISNHYPMMFAHDLNWLILGVVGALSWCVKHFFNLMDRGQTNYTWLFVGITGFIFMVLILADKPQPARLQGGEAVSVVQVKAIMQKHCVSCHSDTPTYEGIEEAPAGLMFDKLEEVIAHAPRIHEQTVASQAMPLGNETGMTEAEREKLGFWIDGLSDE